MYSDPPPPSQFRRPWSPDPHAGNSSNYNHQPFNYDYDDRHDSYMNSYDPTYPRNRREASDHSVEALDLADYTATMRPSHRYPAEAVYPPSPSFQAPPSLVSRGNTMSSSSAASTSRRPFSLPPPATNSRHGHLPQSEVDIAQFPPWSRGWYQGNAHNAVDVPAFLSNESKPKYFEPGYTLTGRGASFGRNGNPYDTLGSGSNPHTHSHRDSYGNSAPWSPSNQDPPSYHGHSSYAGGGLDSETKEARMRLLEKEFGQQASSGKDKDNDFLDENGKPPVGTVDQRGNLVTQGPKKRLATRILQILFALTAAIPSIYAALVIKPDPAPPPAMSPGAIALYIASVITSLVLLYMFIFRPCCCGGRRKSKDVNAANPLINGMMVLPVPGMPGHKKHKGAAKHKKGKRGMMGPPGGDVQVNLIVDPTMFNNPEESDSDDDEERARGYRETGMDDNWSMPGGGYFSGDPGGGGTGRKRNRKAKRRSVFAGLAMEAEWKRARSWVKKVAAVDSFFMLVWGVVFVVILIGERCPIGGFEGWCNAFNASAAAACLLCVAFGVSIFFDVKDLNTSKVSPRTRT